MMTVRLIDDGKHGGNDMCSSESRNLTVSVKAVNDAPGFATPWEIACDTTAFLPTGACQCPPVANVEDPGEEPVACKLHDMTMIGRPFLCPTSKEPDKECEYEGREGVSHEVSESTVRVLEDSGAHAVHGLVQGIYTEEGRPPVSRARFYQTAEDEQLEMVQVAHEDVLGLPGLEYAHSYAYSGDRKYVYVVERELNSLALVERTEGTSSKGAGAGGGAQNSSLTIVDRFAEGQDRVFFTLVKDGEQANFAASIEAACDFEELLVSEVERYVVTASGCQLLDVYAGTTSNRTCISDTCDSACCDALERGIIGHWEMSVSHMYGRHRVNPLDSSLHGQRVEFGVHATSDGLGRPVSPAYWSYKRNKMAKDSSGLLCSESQPSTSIGPATLADLSDTMGAAIFRGAGLFCKSGLLTDWDTPNTMTGASFVMNNGALEAMQFDGRLNTGLLVAEDANAAPINRSMPETEFSFDLWFTLDTTLPEGRERGLLAAFLPGPLDSEKPERLESPCKAGWRLSYTARSEDGDGTRLATVFTFEVVRHNFTNNTDATNATDSDSFPFQDLSDQGNATNRTKVEIDPFVFVQAKAALSLVPGRWYHMLAVSTMSESKLYLNGTLLPDDNATKCPTCLGIAYRQNRTAAAPSTQSCALAPHMSATCLHVTRVRKGNEACLRLKRMNTVSHAA